MRNSVKKIIKGIDRLGAPDYNIDWDLDEGRYTGEFWWWADQVQFTATILAKASIYKGDYYTPDHTHIRYTVGSIEDLKVYETPESEEPMTLTEEESEAMHQAIAGTLTDK